MSILGVNSSSIIKSLESTVSSGTGSIIKSLGVKAGISASIDLSNSTAIAQPEPLYTVRPRYYDNLKRGERGVRSAFRLLTSSSDDKPGSSTISKSVRKKLIGNNGYTDFLLTNISYGFNERMQLHQLFGDHVAAFAFGASPVVLSIQGMLIDDIDNGWFPRFVIAYQDYLRATQLGRNFELLQLIVPNAIFTGVITNVQFQQNADNDVLIPFSMQFLVRAYQYLPKTQVEFDGLPSLPDIHINMDSTFAYKTLRDIAKGKSAALTGKSLITAGETIARNLANQAAVDFGSNIYSSINIGGRDYPVQVAISLSVATSLSKASNTAEIISNNVVTSGNASQLASISNVIGGAGITGLYDKLAAVQSMSISPSAQSMFTQSIFNNYLNSSDTSNNITLNIVGAYGNKQSSQISDLIASHTLSNLVNTLQGDLTFYARLNGYLGDNTVSGDPNATVQESKAKGLAGIINRAEDTLKNSSIGQVVTKDINSALDFIKNEKGSLTKQATSLGDKISSYFRSGSNNSNLAPTLGNTTLGISSQEAADGLSKANTQTTTQQLQVQGNTVPNSTNLNQRQPLMGATNV